MTFEEQRKPYSLRQRKMHCDIPPIGTDDQWMRSYRSGCNRAPRKWIDLLRLQATSRQLKVGTSQTSLYNPKRRHSTIGYLSPMEFERQAGLA
jgi:transposase InsO family protein